MHIRTGQIALPILTALGVALAADVRAADRAAASATPPRPPLCTKGQAVSVRYAGSWYPARVLDGPDRLGTCLVSYDGYGSSWDEWVAADRMRAVEAGAARGKPAGAPPPSANPPHAAAAAAVQPGRYACYTFDAGRLNYSYTDIVVTGQGRYRVGEKAGTFTAAGGALRFTGPLANARGTYSLKRGGKPQIDLVFDGDARASMACSRTR